MNQLVLLLFGLLFCPNIVSANHRNDCEGAADLGNYFINYCEEKCVCEDVSTGLVPVYDHVCYRQREELTCMSESRRVRFFDTWKAVTDPSHPQYTQMKQLLETHDNPNFSSIHVSQWFLPWHRWHILAVENILRNENCKVTVPWWRWSKKSTTWWTGTPFSSDATWLGTNPKGFCMANGAFAPPWYPPTGSVNTCLVREHFNAPFPTTAIINNILNYPASGCGGDCYVQFSNALEGQVHGTPHNNIGGDMSGSLATRDPTFFLHHAYIDKLWDDWQDQSTTHLNVYQNGYNMSDMLPHSPGGTPSSVGENFKLKEQKIMYVNYLPNANGLGHVSSLPFCLMIVADKFKFELSKVKIWDVSALQNALSDNDDFRFDEVPQVPPLPFTYEELKERYRWWFYDDMPDEERLRAEEKLKRLVAENEEAIAKIKKPLTVEELNKSENLATKLLGFDVDDDMVQKTLTDQKFCPLGFKYSNTNGECVEDEDEKEKLDTALKKAEILNGEIVPQKEDPPVSCTPSKKCTRKTGKCVPGDKCIPSKKVKCADHCSGQCVCKIKKK